MVSVSAKKYFKKIQAYVPLSYNIVLCDSVILSLSGLLFEIKVEI
jgi:hypothetical protein